MAAQESKMFCFASILAQCRKIIAVGAKITLRKRHTTKLNIVIQMHDDVREQMYDRVDRPLWLVTA